MRWPTGTATSIAAARRCRSRNRRVRSVEGRFGAIVEDPFEGRVEEHAPGVQLVADGGPDTQILAPDLADVRNDPGDFVEVLAPVRAGVETGHRHPRLRHLVEELVAAVGTVEADHLEVAVVLVLRTERRRQ